MHKLSHKQRGATMSCIYLFIYWLCNQESLFVLEFVPFKNEEIGSLCASGEENMIQKMIDDEP